MAANNEAERRTEEAGAFVAGLYLGVTHELDGDEAPSGNDRTFMLFDRAYLQGLVDMAVHLRRGGSITELAKVIDREMRGYRTGEIETGVLHLRGVGLDLSQVEDEGFDVGAELLRAGTNGGTD